MAMVEIDDKELAELRKTATAGAKATAALDAFQGELKTAKEAAARVPALEAEVGQFKAAQLDGVFKGAGIEDPKVRKLVQMEFDEQAATDGGEKDLGKWLGGLQAMEPEKRPPLLAPFIKTPAAAGAAGNAAGAGAGAGGQNVELPNLDKGAKGVQGAPAAVTAEQIERMSTADFAKNFETLKAQIPGLANVNLPGAKPAVTP